MEIVMLGNFVKGHLERGLAALCNKSNLPNVKGKITVILKELGHYEHSNIWNNRIIKIQWTSCDWRLKYLTWKLFK